MIGIVPFARKVNVTMFILMKNVIFICRGRHEGIANVDTYRDRQGQTATYRDRQGQAGTSMNRQGQVGTSRDIKRMSLFHPPCPCLSLPCPSLSLFHPACPCLSLPCPSLSLFHPDCPCLFLFVPTLSLLVPGLSLALTGIIGK